MLTNVDGTKWRQRMKYQARRGLGSAIDQEHDFQSSDRRGDESRRRVNDYSFPIYYVTDLQVPLGLPARKKMFIPSFVLRSASTLPTSWNGKSVVTTQEGFELYGVIRDWTTTVGASLPVYINGRLAVSRARNIASRHYHEAA